MVALVASMAARAVVKIKRFRIEIGNGPRGFSRWVQPVMSKYFLACCDCGLVHEMQFRIVGARKRRVQFRARRAERYTTKLRRRDLVKR